MLGYAHAAVVEAACLHIPVTAAMIGVDGLVADPSKRDLVASVLANVVEFAGCTLDRRPGPEQWALQDSNL